MVNRFQRERNLHQMESVFYKHVACFPHPYHVFEEPHRERLAAPKFQPHFFHKGTNRAVAHPLRKRIAPAKREVRWEEVYVRSMYTNASTPNTTKCRGVG